MFPLPRPNPFLETEDPAPTEVGRTISRRAYFTTAIFSLEPTSHAPGWVSSLCEPPF